MNVHFRLSSLSNFLLLIFLILTVQSCTTYTDPRSGDVIKPEPAVTSPNDLNILYPRYEFALPKDFEDIRSVRQYTLPDGSSTKDLPDLFSRIRVGLKMSNLNSPQVDRFIETYANQAALDRTFARAQYFLYDIIEELEKRNMPTELALLPIVESSYITKAVSHASAVGVWQFIPVTGKRFGLEQNHWLDERQFTPKATTAALDYLEFLHKRFNNWHLALAAYNCGEGCVDRALKNAGVHFSEITYDDLPIPTETLQYAPRLQALKEIIADPKYFKIKLPHIANKKVTKNINVNVPINNKVAAKLAGVSVDEFNFLNAHLKKNIYHPTIGEIILPIDAEEEFNNNLSDYTNIAQYWSIYQVIDKTSLSLIASKYQTTVSAIQAANPGIGINPPQNAFLIIPSNTPTNGINDNNEISDLPKVTIISQAKVNKKAPKKVVREAVSVKNKQAVKEKYIPPKPATKEEILSAKQKALERKKLTTTTPANPAVKTPTKPAVKTPAKPAKSNLIKPKAVTPVKPKVNTTNKPAVKAPIKTPPKK